jgi:hypothetical protein
MSGRANAELSATAAETESAESGRLSRLWWFVPSEAVVFHISEGAIGDQRCPFLALSMQQRAANGSKRRHKAKVENRRILRMMRRDPATSSTSPQRAANVSCSAC